MYRHEKVRGLGTRPSHAFTQGQEVVAVAGQYRFHSRLGVDPGVEFLRYLEHHVLLAQAILADRAGILAAVPGIDGDDEVAGIARRMHDPDGPRRGRRSRGGHIDDEPVAIAIVGFRQKALGVGRPGQVEDDAQLPRQDGQMHILDLAAARRTGSCALANVAAGNLQDHALRVVQHAHGMSRAAREFENDPRVIRRGPDSDSLDIDGPRRCAGYAC